LKISWRTGIWRNTKDLDIYLKPADLKIVMDECQAAGFGVEVTDGRWLAKVRWQEFHLDLIFAVANQLFAADDSFLQNPRPVCFFGVESYLLSLEAMIASKVHIAKSYRFDGADILHLIRSAEGRIDWQQLLVQLKNHGELLLWHLILVDFVYPGHSHILPKNLMIQLFNQVQRRWEHSQGNPSFRGCVIDPSSFAVDTKFWGYPGCKTTPPLVNEKGELL
jgi:hypothetical protein